MKTCNSSSWKGKGLLQSRWDIADIGELAGKKSLFEDILVFFKAEEIWKEPGDFRSDFQGLLSVQ